MSLKGEIVYRMVPSYTMKIRIYPNREQREQIDNYLTALEKAANMTLWALKNHDPMICREDKAKEDENLTIYWPDWYCMAKKEWLDYLRSENSLVAALPSTALSSSVGGLFLNDMKKAWEKQGKLPVDAWFNAVNKKGKKILKFYKGTKTKDGYFTRIPAKNFIRVSKNTVRIKVPKIGELKARGWNHKIKYGANAQFDFWTEFKGTPGKTLSCRIVRNNIGEYYLTVATKNACRPFKVNADREPVGIDINIKQDAGVVLSNGNNFPNPRFKKQKAAEIDFLETCLSRRYGMSNEEYRQDRARVKRRNKLLPYAEQMKMPEPSKRYQKADHRLKHISITIQRQREQYQHTVAARTVAQADFIAMEDLDVKAMMKDRNYSEGLGDSAFSAQLGKIKYKADWFGTEVKKIEKMEPSSHICPDCGYVIPVDERFGTGTRDWTCPVCGIHHDRDFAAARTILKLATGELSPTPYEPLDPTADVPFGPKHPDRTTKFIVEMVEEYKNPWVVASEDGTVMDDAQGYGYDTAQKAQRAYKWKLKQQVKEEH